MLLLATWLSTSLGPQRDSPGDSLQLPSSLLPPFRPLPLHLLHNSGNGLIGDILGSLPDIVFHQALVGLDSRPAFRLAAHLRVHRGGGCRGAGMNTASIDARPSASLHTCVRICGADGVTVCGKYWELLFWTRMQRLHTQIAWPFPPRTTPRLSLPTIHAGGGEQAGMNVTPFRSPPLPTTYNCRACSLHLGLPLLPATNIYTCRRDYPHTSPSPSPPLQHTHAGLPPSAVTPSAVKPPAPAASCPPPPSPHRRPSRQPPCRGWPAGHEDEGGRGGG